MVMRTVVLIIWHRYSQHTWLRYQTCANVTS